MEFDIDQKRLLLAEVTKADFDRDSVYQQLQILLHILKETKLEEISFNDMNYPEKTEYIKELINISQGTALV